MLCFCVCVCLYIYTFTFIQHIKSQAAHYCVFEDTTRSQSDKVLWCLCIKYSNIFYIAVSVACFSDVPGQLHEQQRSTLHWGHHQHVNSDGCRVHMDWMMINIIINVWLIFSSVYFLISAADMIIRACPVSNHLSSIHPSLMSVRPLNRLPQFFFWPFL